MGDILHALPAVTALRMAHPDWVIDWVVEPRWRALLAAEQTIGKPGETPEKHTSGAKAPAFIAPFNARAEALAYQPINAQPQPLQPLVDHLHFAATKEWRKAPFSRQTFREFRALRAALRGGEYDAVIDLQGAIRSALLARMAGCGRVIGEAEPRERAAHWLFTERVATRGMHVIEQDMELVSAIAGDALKPVQPWLPVDPAAEAWADTILPIDPEGKSCMIKTHPSDNNKGVARVGHPEFVGKSNHGIQPAVLINPGAGWGAKRWPAERYAAVAQGLVERGCRVLVNAGPGEEPLAELIASQTGGAATPLACSLAQLIALTRRLALAIAGDTGPLHLACALGRPVVGIYGPTDPARNGPFGTQFKVLRSPLSRRDHTRYQTPEAGLLTIQPEDVLRAAWALLYPETAPETSL
jgi:heptosyltransferase-1